MMLLVFSAGVGRTGVLIGMLTAWSCIDTGLAVNMVEIVQQMRDQRPVLVQTSVSMYSGMYEDCASSTQMQTHFS